MTDDLHSKQGLAVSSDEGQGQGQGEGQLELAVAGDAMMMVVMVLLLDEFIAACVEEDVMEALMRRASAGGDVDA